MKLPLRVISFYGGCYGNFLPFQLLCQLSYSPPIHSRLAKSVLVQPFVSHQNWISQYSIMDLVNCLVYIEIAIDADLFLGVDGCILSSLLNPCVVLYPLLALDCTNIVTLNSLKSTSTLVGKTCDQQRPKFGICVVSSMNSVG